MENNPDSLERKNSYDFNDDFSSIIQHQTNVDEIWSPATAGMKEPDEKSSLVESNKTSFCNIPAQQCDLQLKKQGKRNQILDHTLHKICQNRNVSIYIQLMKLLNCTKKRKCFAESINCKDGVVNKITCNNAKNKDKMGNTPSKVSKSKTYVTRIKNHLTKFIEVLGLNELLPKENTSNSQDIVGFSGLEVTEKHKNRNSHLFRKKSLALLEAILKILKMKNPTKLSQLIKPILRVAIHATTKLQSTDNWMTEEFQTKYFETSNRFIYENNYLNKKSIEFTCSNHSNKSNIDYCKQDIAEVKKEHSTQVGKTAQTENELTNRNNLIQVINLPKSNKVIDLRAVKCQDTNSTSNKECKSIEINSNKVGSKPSASRLVSLKKGTKKKVIKYKEVTVAGSSNSLSTCYNTNLTTAKCLQQNGSEPILSVLTGPKQTLLGKRANENNLGSSLDEILAKKKSTEFDNNVILTSAPCSEEFYEILVERTLDCQNTSLKLYKNIKDNNVKGELDKYRRCLAFLELKQRFEITNDFGNFMCSYPFNQQFDVDLEHCKQRCSLEQQLDSRLQQIDGKFEEVFNRLVQQQRKHLDILRTNFKQNSLKSQKLTIPLRKGPIRENNYTICYQQITSTPRIIITLLREDEVYDYFYAHKIS